MSKWTLAKLKKRLDAKDMTIEEAAYIAGELLQENAEIEAKLEAAQLVRDEFKGQCVKLEAQLTAEEQCAMESGGILSDVCDLVFDDSERAATHGYEGVHNKIAEIKNRLRLYQIQIDKYCGADNVGCDGFCAGCPLGKCGVNNGEKTKTKSL